MLSALASDDDDPNKAHHSISSFNSDVLSDGRATRAMSVGATSVGATSMGATSVGATSVGATSVGATSVGANLTWSSGGSYLTEKSTLAYTVKCTNDPTEYDKQTCFSGQTTYPEVALSPIACPSIFGPCTEGVLPAYTVGSEWLYTNSCSSALLAAVGSTGDWGAATSADKTSVCTDSKTFSPATTSASLPATSSRGGLVVESVSYLATNYTLAVVTVVFYVTVSGINATVPATPAVLSNVGFSGHTNLRNAIYDVPSLLSPLTVLGTNSNLVTGITSDAGIPCRSLSYTLGRLNSTSIDITATLPPTMQGCVVHSQTTSCDQSSNSSCCRSGGICPACCTTNTLTNFAESQGPPMLYRKTDAYFAALVGGADAATICEFAYPGNPNGKGACPMLHGVVRPLAAAQQYESVYAHEPNPFRDSDAYPATCTNRDAGCMSGLAYAIPITYSLLNPCFLIQAGSTAAVPPSSTYLTQLLSSTCSSSSGSNQVCATTTSSVGWIFLESMLSDLSSLVSPGIDPAYDTFAAGYGAYAAMQMYLLSVCGYTAHLAGSGLVSAYPQFLGQFDWASTAGLFASLATASLAGGGKASPLLGATLTTVFGADATQLCSSARPVLGSYVGNSIPVTLTVPAILVATVFGSGVAAGGSTSSGSTGDGGVSSAVPNAQVVAALLLQMFPDAKFVHIHRNPYDVFHSTRKMLKAVAELHRLQRAPAEEELDDWILRMYRKMYDAYFEERSLIPSGQFHEVRFEQLERNPIGQIAGIYESLQLPDVTHFQAELKSYVSSIADYRKNSFPDLPAELRQRIAKEWRRSFEEWGYSCR